MKIDKEIRRSAACVRRRRINPEKITLEIHIPYRPIDIG